mgnify:CR=1 FL=1
MIVDMLYIKLVSYKKKYSFNIKVYKNHWWFFLSGNVSKQVLENRCDQDSPFRKE